MLRTLHVSIDLNVLRMAYFGHIHCHLTYYTIVWGKGCDAKGSCYQKGRVGLVRGMGPMTHCEVSFYFILEKFPKYWRPILYNKLRIDSFSKHPE